MQSLHPLYTTQTKGYIATVAEFFLSNCLVSLLQPQVTSNQSRLYQNPDNTVNTTMNTVDPGFSVVVGDPKRASPTTNTLIVATVNPSFSLQGTAVDHRSPSRGIIVRTVQGDKKKKVTLTIQNIATSTPGLGAIHHLPTTTSAKLAAIIVPTILVTTIVIGVVIWYFKRKRPSASSEATRSNRSMWSIETVLASRRSLRSQSQRSLSSLRPPGELEDTDTRPELSGAQWKRELEASELARELDGREVKENGKQKPGRKKQTSRNYCRSGTGVGNDGENVSVLVHYGRRCGRSRDLCQRSRRAIRKKRAIRAIEIMKSCE